MTCAITAISIWLIFLIAIFGTLWAMVHEVKAHVIKCAKARRKLKKQRIDLYKETQKSE